METKTLSFEVKDVNMEEGTFTAHASIFGNVDLMNDIVAKGAFTKTLKERGKKIFVAWMHDWAMPIGKPMEIYEDNHGLMVKAKLSKTTAGKDALILLRDGVVQEMSIGFDVIKQDYAKVDEHGNIVGDEVKSAKRVRVIKEVRLYEVSLVTVAANPEAQVLQVKEKPKLDKTRDFYKIEEKEAIPYEETGIAPEGTPWDAVQEMAKANGNVDDLRAMCALIMGDAQDPNAYKLPHHLSGSHLLVQEAVEACASALVKADGQAQPQEQPQGSPPSQPPAKAAPPVPPKQDSNPKPKPTQEQPQEEQPQDELQGAKDHIAQHYEDLQMGAPPWENQGEQPEQPEQQPKPPTPPSKRAELRTRLSELKGAIPYKKTPLAPEDTPWSASAEMAKEETPEGWRALCAMVDGDPEKKGSYKLPHHQGGGDHACVWNGVRAAAAALRGARGGVEGGGQEGARAHIAKHYRDFKKGNPPWESSSDDNATEPSKGILSLRQRLLQGKLTELTKEMGDGVE